MMARLTQRNLYILGATDERFAPDTIAAKGVGNTDSAYTEASPRPGTAVTTSSRSMLTPRVSGAQEAALTLRVQRGGAPGRAGVELSYQGESDSQRRCWSSPNIGKTPVQTPRHRRPPRRWSLPNTGPRIGTIRSPYQRRG